MWCEKFYAELISNTIGWLYFLVTIFVVGHFCNKLHKRWVEYAYTIEDKANEPS